MKDTFFISPLDQIDLTKVEVVGLSESLLDERAGRRGARAPRRFPSLRLAPETGKDSRAMTDVHHSADCLDDPGHPARHPDDVPHDEADRGEPFPAHRAERAGGHPGEPRAEVPPRQALVRRSTRYYVKGVFTFDLGPSMAQRNADGQRHRQGRVPALAQARAPRATCGRSSSAYPPAYSRRSGRTRSSTTAPCSSRASASRCRASSWPRCSSTSWR